jgi:tRNA pseudouridine32 synthase/23S rRNA pseudouridine746 synthase
VLSVPDRQGVKSERECLWPILNAYYQQEVLPVHRLDFEVSGIILYAKSKEAQRVASSWFEDRKIKKYYEALCEKASRVSEDHVKLTLNLDDERALKISLEKMREGIPFEWLPKGFFYWNHKMMRGKKRAYFADYGKSAVTAAYYLQQIQLESRPPLYHFILQPHTGRPHQLRLELSAHGYPVWGDLLYGSTHSFEKKETIALRSVRIDLTGIPEAIERFQLPKVLNAPFLLSGPSVG